MNNSTRSRRSRAFRPSIIGFDHLEARQLLTIDPSLVILPDPVADFDPNNYTLVDSATFDAHLAILESAASNNMTIAYTSFSEIEGGEDTDKPRLIDSIEQKKNLLIAQLIVLKIEIQKSLDDATFLSGKMGSLINTANQERNALPDIPANAVKRGEYKDFIDTTQDKKNKIDANIIEYQSAIDYLDQLIPKIVFTGDYMIANIETTNTAADPSDPPSYSYSVATTPIA